MDMRVIGPTGKIRWEVVAWLGIGIVTGWWIAFLNLSEKAPRARLVADPPFRQSAAYDDCLAQGQSLVTCDAAMRVRQRKNEEAKLEACLSASTDDDPFACYFDPDRVRARKTQ